MLPSGEGKTVRASASPGVTHLGKNRELKQLKRTTATRMLQICII